MAISRMNMERQLRNMGGIMTLDEPRQGYFLGKIVRKAKKAVKKVVKSPLGKAALLGAGAYFMPGVGIKAQGGLGGLLAKIKSGQGFMGQLGNVFRVGGEAGKDFSALRLLGGAAGLGAIAAPFLMGGDEEEIDEGVDVSGVQPMVANIRQQARDFYRNPASREDSGLFFMPQQQFVQPSFFAAGGGLADIPREGYNRGKIVKGGMEGLAQLLKKEQARSQRISGNLRADNMQRTQIGKPKLDEDEYDYYREILDDEENNIVMGDETREMLEAMVKEQEAEIAYMKRLYDKGALNPTAGETTMGRLKMLEKKAQSGEALSADEIAEIKRLSEIFNKADGGRVPMQEGGIMDLGGMEKDYREGGFVPIGAEERADDVPARLSKNEFVFTADAVRNAGGGDIDKGAEVMQNMMDNLEAGGMISEESQGKENPAQAMFDQAQMLEGRLA